MSILDEEFIKRVNKEAYIDETNAIPSDSFYDPVTIIPLGDVVFETEDDEKVCPLCDEFDGERFAFDDATKPIPPMHPNCRCIYRYENTDDVIKFSGGEWDAY